jgi:hypothetical protein
MLSCDSLLDRIIARFNLMKLYKVKYPEDARKTLSKRAKISANSKNAIISVEVTDNDATRAAEISNAFIEELDKLLQRLAHQEARERMAFLEKERVLATLNLTKAEETLRTFSEKNSVLHIDAQTRGVIEYIARLRGEIDAKEVQIQVLRQQATSFNYDVVRLETESKGLKEKLRAEIQYGLCMSLPSLFQGSRNWPGISPIVPGGQIPGKPLSTLCQVSGNSPHGYGPKFFGDPGIRSRHNPAEKVQPTAIASYTCRNDNILYDDLCGLRAGIYAKCAK